MNDEKLIILDTFVEVAIGSRNKQFYINKGYKCNINDIITIPINDLSEKSRIKIKVKCPMCGKERYIEYRQIVKSKHTYCNQCASHIFNYKDYKCDYCGEKSHATINGIHYCNKHYNQFKRYGHLLKRTNRDLNEVEIADDYIKVFTYNIKNEINNFFIIDKEGYDKIKEYKWSINTISKQITSTINGKQILLQYFLINKNNNFKYILFKNGNKLDFRYSNLIPSNNKFIKKSFDTNTTSIHIIDNIKVEEIDNNKLRLLNIRDYSKDLKNSNIKDIVVEIDDNGCWNCISHSKYRGGYIKVYKNGKNIKLHREVLSIKLGRKLLNTEVTRHKCDNPQCCNPEHLEVGTMQDNVNDMIQRERAFWQTHPKEKFTISKRNKANINITEDDVTLIYKKVVGENISQKHICEEYGYTRGIVQNIINKKTWKHLTDKIDEEIQDKRKIDIIDKVKLIKNLSTCNLYTNREISKLTNINRETVGNVKNGKIYKDIWDSIETYCEPIIYCSSILYNSLVDGEGLRNVCFCSFCEHNCLGCHNYQTHLITNGKPKTISELFNLLTSTPIGDITFSGGDPMYQSKAFELLARKIKLETNKSIWIYSGFTYEEIIKDKNMFNLLIQCDVLVDGKFDIDKKNISLKFKGSSNQRFIDIQKSLKQNEIILWNN